MSQQSVDSGSQKSDHERSLIEHVNHLVRTARLAAAVFTQYSQEDVDRIVKAMTLAALENVYTFAQMAHEETHMGQLEDKMLKDFVASEFLYNQIKNKRTVGVVREFPEDNMVEIAEPMGVILALSPVTKPDLDYHLQEPLCCQNAQLPHLQPALDGGKQLQFCGKSSL